MAENSSEEINKNIIKYYNNLTFSYKRYSVGTNNMHCGYWPNGYREKGIRKKGHREALERMNAILAEAAQVQSEDKIFDAGCGMGGSAVWLAKTFGCRVAGVTLCEQHISLAERFARKNHVNHLCQFLCKDFSHTDFESTSFDLVWALESSCYAVDKRKFIEEAARLLKPRGRLIVADGFLKKTELSENEHKIVDAWMRGWAVPHVVSVEQFGGYLEKGGFDDVKWHDRTKNIMPTSQRMHRIAKVVYPIADMMNRLGFWPPHTKDHWYAALMQAQLFTEDISCYGLFSARKKG